MNVDIDKCETDPTQPDSIWTCDWSRTREEKFCNKTCKENFRPTDGFTNLTCNVNSGWFKQPIAKCIPDIASDMAKKEKQKEKSQVVRPFQILKKSNDNIADGK